MSAYALITGALFRAPESRVSKAGKPYASATVRVKDGDAMQFWRIMAFGEAAVAELMRLKDGDALSAQGTLRAELYKPEGGEPRLSLSLMADVVTPLRAVRKPRPDAQETRSGEASGYHRSGRSNAPSGPRHAMDRHGGDREDAFGDRIPF